MKIYLLSLVLFISGCSYAHYQDGQIRASGFALGTNKALEGLQYMKGKEGTQFQIKGLDINQSEGLNAAGNLLGNAIGTALKVYTGKP